MNIYDRLYRFDDEEDEYENDPDYVYYWNDELVHNNGDEYYPEDEFEYIDDDLFIGEEYKHKSVLSRRLK